MFGLLVVVGVALTPVIKADGFLQRFTASEACVIRHFTDIPNFEQLIFAVWGEVETIAFARNISDAFLVTNEDAGGCVLLSEGSSVPNFYVAVVGSCEEQIWTFSICPTNWVDLIVMSIVDYSRCSILHEIKDENFTSFRAS